MYDFWIGNVNLAPILIFFTVAVILPGQLILCWKVKSVAIRLLPAVILLILTVFAVIAAVACTGWEIVFFVVSAIYLTLMLLACGIAWGVWTVWRFVSRKIK